MQLQNTLHNNFISACRFWFDFLKILTRFKTYLISFGKDFHTCRSVRFTGGLYQSELLTLACLHGQKVAHLP